MDVDSNWATDWVRRSADAVAAHKADLAALDRAIGDGDHGENLDRGYQAALAALDGLGDDATPADALMLVATTLISNVGGAAGPLYGTAFLKASGAAQGLDELGPSDVVAILTAARDGIVLRGKAEPGDKTMVDAWTPAVEAASAAAAAGSDVRAVLEAAAGAAEQGAADTEPLVARKGRASYLGERSAGHRDPGAESTALLLRAAAEAAADAAERRGS
ncbi:dihydroxyacetone kinase subunit DhaL [Agromyces mangrovi Wang et al. 2018]|uniref:dihydroxyacetone kinase subunit DhaL n=1 Tax=Agromyces mangrovi TaxID=1858653 RepID=UPI0025735748|nr:dihydroxyacetone kinase subunit DhaL [Agromyces mangrovi]BDZ66339.1 dihydroxyacetone kinase subunit L [Agromyces mangrovi]